MFLLLLCQLGISFIFIPFLYIYTYTHCSSFTFPAEIKLSTEKCRKLFAPNSSYSLTFFPHLNCSWNFRKFSFSLLEWKTKEKDGIPFSDWNLKMLDW
jgi:hypothetical protein